MALAKRGDCVQAVPLLEEGESKRHRPSSALALADCYVALGELLKAGELYHSIAAEKPGRKYAWWDNAAIERAKKKATALDKRIPTVTFAIEESYDELEIEVDGRLVRDSTLPFKVPPDVKIVILARAKGYDEMSQEVVLAEGERRIVKLRLEPLGAAGAGAGKHETPGKKPRDKQPPGPRKDPRGEPELWLGGGYQGYLLPQFMFGLFGEGGRTLFAPGGGLSLTIKTSDIDVIISATYASFRLGETPFKPSGQPDTEYEILESDLQSLLASAHLMWDIPLDQAGTFRFRVGGGIGVGWTFLGDLYRPPAYPPSGAGDDPSKWEKCRGPNDPQGSFLHCNQLRHDRDHYFGYVEPSWFSGGHRPLIYPWLALPELGLAIHPSRAVAFDIGVGLSLTGLLTRAGVRFGL
ncbi:MAG TPA: hypothetical protein VLS89_19145 [Candidatus Nanopelagicales bacterium]|nr:hypothetical protein [Candidatus Nanopelagicales bacterium]